MYDIIATEGTQTVSHHTADTYEQAVNTRSLVRAELHKTPGRTVEVTITRRR